jgi:hypothetical protein
MVTPIKSEGFAVVKLLLHLGTTPNSQVIPLFEVAPPHAWVQKNTVAITEYFDLSLELVSNDPRAEIEVMWEQIEWLTGEESSPPIRLKSPQRTAKLFDNKVQQEYPWRCGVYQFEIRYNNQKYSGLYEIVPKNVSKSGLIAMQNLISSYVQGMIYDLLASKQVEEGLAEWEQGVNWKFVQWYQHRKPLLLSAIRHIEVNEEQELITAYRIDSQPRRQSTKSLSWQQKYGEAKAGQRKYLNRVLVARENTEINENSKWRIHDLLKRMQWAIDSFQGLLRQHEEQITIMTQQIDQLTNRLEEKQQQQRVIHKSDMENMKTTIQIKRDAKNKLAERLRTLQPFHAQFVKSYEDLQERMQSSFWRQIKSRPPAKPIQGQGWGHKRVSQVWRESLMWESQNHNADHRTPSVIRPTSDIYEYYVFFVVRGILESLGFTSWGEDFTTMRERTIHLDGLEDGAVMSLSNGRIIVKVTFNELIDSDAEIASFNGSHFYSSEVKRKPDLRLDAIDAESGQYLHCSMIVEVKYRPFYYIYNTKGVTETMLQLGKYWAISYVDDSKDYHHSVVKKVVCVYPGETQAKVKEQSPQGLFIQLYPGRKEEIVGRKELTDEITSWLAKAFRG